MWKEGAKKEKLLELHGSCLAAAPWLSLELNAFSIPWGLSLIKWHIAGLILAQPSLLTRFLSGIMRPRKRLECKTGICLFKCFLFVSFYSTLCSFPAPLLQRVALPENLVAQDASEERCLKRAQRRPITCLLVWVGFILPVFANCKLPWRAHNYTIVLIWYTCTYDGNSAENKSWV